jgi:tetratricopeptide (TPR) repeat protein
VRSGNCEAGAPRRRPLAGACDSVSDRLMPTRPHRPLLVPCAVVALLVALPALAQQPSTGATTAPSDYPPPCDAARVSKGDIDRAHTVFLSGKQFLEESNYDKAIGYFKDAYAIDCSVHAMLPIIATAYERKGDKTEAVRALDEYLRRAPAAPDHDVIERRIRNLKEQIARDQAAAAAAAPPPPPPPPSATAPSPSAPPPPETAPPPASSVASPSPSPPHDTEGHTVLPWVVVGVGSAALVAGVVLFAVGAGDISSALSACKGQRSPCPSQSAVDQGNSGRTLEQVGGPLIGTGAGLAVVGLVWHFLEKPADNAAAATALEFTPAVGPTYEGVALRARF